MAIKRCSETPSKSEEKTPSYSLVKRQRLFHTTSSPKVPITVHLQAQCFQDPPKDDHLAHPLNLTEWMANEKE